MSRHKKKIPPITLEPQQMENIAVELIEGMQKNPGMTLKQATGFSDEVLEEIYHLAYTYYNQGKYQESIALFQFLSGVEPKSFKYVFGLAASYHQIASYEQAAIGFYIAMTLEPTDPTAAYYLTDCFLKQDLNEEAAELAEVTIGICDDRPEYAALKSRCQLILEKLKK